MLNGHYPSTGPKWHSTKVKALMGISIVIVCLLRIRCVSIYYCLVKPSAIAPTTRNDDEKKKSKRAVIFSNKC